MRNVVKRLKGYEIEERENRGNKYYVIWCDGGYNIAHSLDEAIDLINMWEGRK